MRELNRHEVEEVSGAGFITDALANFGGLIGSIVDQAKKTGTQSTQLGANTGSLIGQGVEGVIATVSSVVNGILGLFKKK